MALAMLYDLVQKHRGKETVMMTDTIAKVEAQKKKYKTSQGKKLNGSWVEYFIRPSESDDSYKRRPNRRATSGGDYRLHRPERVK